MNVCMSGIERVTVTFQTPHIEDVPVAHAHQVPNEELERGNSKAFLDPEASRFELTDTRIGVSFGGQLIERGFKLRLVCFSVPEYRVRGVKGSEYAILACFSREREVRRHYYEQWALEALFSKTAREIHVVTDKRGKYCDVFARDLRGDRRAQANLTLDEGVLVSRFVKSAKEKRSAVRRVTDAV